MDAELMEETVFAVGNDELSQRPEAKAGEMVECQSRFQCPGGHVLEHGVDKETDEESEVLLFYTCEASGHSYLAGINGRLLLDNKKVEAKMRVYVHNAPKSLRTEEVVAAVDYTHRRSAGGRFVGGLTDEVAFEHKGYVAEWEEIVARLPELVKESGPVYIRYLGDGNDSGSDYEEEWMWPFAHKMVGEKLPFWVEFGHSDEEDYDYND